MKRTLIVAIALCMLGNGLLAQEIKRDLREVRKDKKEGK